MGQYQMQYLVHPFTGIDELPVIQMRERIEAAPVANRQSQLLAKSVEFCWFYDHQTLPFEAVAQRLERQGFLLEYPPETDL